MIRTVDGAVQFATHIISNGTEEHFAFSDVDLFEIKSGLEGVNWTIKPFVPPQTKKDKARGNKYNSRSEAIEHLDNDKEPEHLRKRRLEKDNADLLARIERLEKLIGK